MMRVPSFVLKMAASQGEREHLLEYRLDTFDVARMLGRVPRTVLSWTTGAGLAGRVLLSRTWTPDHGAKRAYRLRDVEEFAAFFGMPIDYGELHPVLAREWKIGPNGEKGWTKPSVSASIETPTEREEPA